ncbi:MAG: PEP-CTERM sorting domain-containing protein [Planctomycetota bacterium]
MKFTTSFLFCGFLTLILVPQRAKSEVILTVQNVGPDVVATANGSLNLTALTATNAQSSVYMIPDRALVRTGTTPSVQVDRYVTATGPTSLGSGGFIFADSGTGDRFGVEGQLFDVYDNYVSGTSLSSTATWNNQSLSTLGLTPGIYSWTWGSGASADSITMYVGAVPEPASFQLLLAVGLIATRFRHRRKPSLC